jgi:hypothetical protein
MTLNQRIEAFDQLGKHLASLEPDQKRDLFQRAADQNPWFTPDSLALAFQGIIFMLGKEKLIDWTGNYALEPSQIKKIGVVMAGNIPMVGFHDFLSVLMSGHQLVAKTSSQDNVLIPYLGRKLIEIEPKFESRISFQERLNGCDAMIATGSDNTSRYFEYYFRNIPHIIRKNRSSCAIIMGEESPIDFKELGKDIFSYYGLGCRNIAKLYIPDGFDLSEVLRAWESYKDIVNHNKYANNYDYNKSIYLVTQVPFLDTGFVMLTESEALVSPISVVYYEVYLTLDDLRQKIAKQKEKIQCIVSAKGWYKGSIPFGQTQHPEVWDYADQVDTLDFLSRV